MLEECLGDTPSLQGEEGQGQDFRGPVQVGKTCSVDVYLGGSHQRQQECDDMVDGAADRDTGTWDFGFARTPHRDV